MVKWQTNIMIGNNYWKFLNRQYRQSYLLTRWNQKKDHHSRNQKGDNVHDFEQKLNYLAICIIHIWSFFSEPFKLLEIIKRIDALIDYITIET